MSYIVRFYLVNSLTFVSNILVYFLLTLIFDRDRSMQQEHLLSVFSHILTIPVSFFLNYRFVFSETNERTNVLVNRFIISSLLFILIFKALHMTLQHGGLWGFPTHLMATLMGSFLNFCVLHFWVFRRQNTPPCTGENKLKLILHADDFGICHEVTDDIMDCIDSHCIYRTSVICNTEGVTQAAKQFTARNGDFAVGLHLNLVEGSPISTPTEVDQLVSRRTGEFKHSFLMLWKDYILGNRRKKELLRKQIRLEIENQILTFNKFFNKDGEGLHIDGHTHIHILPFVLNIIIDLSKKYNIRSIRLPNERFFLCTRNLRHYLSASMVKHIVLKILSRTQVDKLKKSGLKYNDYLIGVLATGEMTHENVASALSALKGIKEDAVVEILFHPGGVRYKVSVNWTSNMQFINYYADVNRRKEKNLLCNGSLKDITYKHQLVNKL